MRIGIFCPAQRASLVTLMLELCGYYGSSGQWNATDIGDHLDESLIGPNSPIARVTAEAPDGQVVGLAALVLLPSLVEAVGTGRMQCQLKELFVPHKARAQGVGEALLRWSAGFALDHGCGRMDWNVRAGNAAGIRVYERHGAQLVDDRLSYRIAGASLADLASAGPR